MSFKSRSVSFAAAISTVLTVAAVASAAYSAAAPSIEFHAKGPIGVSIDGKSNNLTVTENDSTVTFTTKMEKLDTGNEGRNKHMKERFDAGKFQTIELAVPKSEVEKKDSGKVKAKLTFHGVTKGENIEYSNKGGHVKADFSINVFDYGIKEEQLCFEPRTKSICAKKDVKIHVEFDLKK